MCNINTAPREGRCPLRACHKSSFPLRPSKTSQAPYHTERGANNVEERRESRWDRKWRVSPQTGGCTRENNMPGKAAERLIMLQCSLSKQVQYAKYPRNIFPEQAAIEKYKPAKKKLPGRNKKNPSFACTPVTIHELPSSNL